MKKSFSLKITQLEFFFCFFIFFTNYRWFEYLILYISFKIIYKLLERFLKNKELNNDRN